MWPSWWRWFCGRSRLCRIRGWRLWFLPRLLRGRLRRRGRGIGWISWSLYWYSQRPPPSVLLLLVCRALAEKVSFRRKANDTSNRQVRSRALRPPLPPYRQQPQIHFALYVGSFCLPSHHDITTTSRHIPSTTLVSIARIIASKTSFVKLRAAINLQIITTTSEVYLR